MEHDANLHEHEMLDNLIHHIGRFAVAILRRRLDIGAALSDVIADQLEEMIRYAHKQLQSCGTRDHHEESPPKDEGRVDSNRHDGGSVDTAIARTAQPLSAKEQAKQALQKARRFRTVKRRRRWRSRRS